MNLQVLLQRYEKGNKVGVSGEAKHKAPRMRQDAQWVEATEQNTKLRVNLEK